MKRKVVTDNPDAPKKDCFYLPGKINDLSVSYGRISENITH